MKRSLLLLFIIVNIIATTPFVYASDKELSLPDFPEIESRFIVLMDADSGEVLYQNNKDARCYPASTTKLLTALLTVENSMLSDTVTYSKAAVKSITYGDANASISEGEELTIEQSLYCLMLRSANDVAYGLGEHVGGTISNFADMMNDRVAALGAKNTHFTNASGLTDEFHYSTPYDMALIGRACFNNKMLMNIMTHKGVYTIGKTNKSNFTRYYSHRFQMLPGGEHEYQYSKGGKTGYTDAAGNCLVSFAEKDGIRLICSVMNSSDAGRYNDTIALFDYYFNNYKKVYLDDIDKTVTSNLDVLELTADVVNPNNISVGYEKNAYLLVPNSINGNELTSIATYANSPAYAGKEGGFACINYYYKGVSVGNTTVFVNSTGYTYSESQDIIYVNTFVLASIVIVGVGIISLIVIKIRHDRGGYGNSRTKKLHF